MTPEQIQNSINHMKDVENYDGQKKYENKSK